MAERVLVEVERDVDVATALRRVVQRVIFLAVDLLRSAEGKLCLAVGDVVQCPRRRKSTAEQTLPQQEVVRIYEIREERLLAVDGVGDLGLCAVKTKAFARIVR